MRKNRNVGAIVAVVTAGLVASRTSAFVPMASSPASWGKRTAVFMAEDDMSFSPPDTAAEISEQACTDAAARMRRINVPVSTTVSPTETVGISYIHWPAEKTSTPTKKTLPLLLVHGFDSSCLEYRRLGPKLAALGIDTYAVDLLGWGYTQLEGVNSFSAEAKVEALQGFWNTVGKGSPVCVAGASLGGAAAIEFGSASPDMVKGAIFIDAQGFVDGVGPMAALPKPLARLGVKVLKSVPLRNSANQMSYYKPETFATDDALKVGRMHCLRDGWDDALVSFMLSGGFSPSKKVETISAPSLVLWGRQDGILDGKEFATKFVETLPDAELRWIEECGHVPHLEQPEETAQVIASFLRSEKFAPLVMELVTMNNMDPSMSSKVMGGLLGAAAVAGVATTAMSIIQ
uniref:AB hydrolase-1 domain-containing protein n=1 Tax=Attheya septentrionalis TaxID=420275 RepID=A0A7S2UEY2_9STRA|mmetsp:Transcript_21184/g.38232  ORF Transcript_21184/g.38232 Transcript_21184/m.38232 type:complete len:403 (+) Transcript_21184:43-1251(+)